jgi:hypothetical protein
MRPYSFISNYLQSSGWELASNTEKLHRRGNHQQNFAFLDVSSDLGKAKAEEYADTGLINGE